jgi:hypothetical protein
MTSHPCRGSRHGAFVLSLLVPLAWATAARGEEAYFLLVFGSQRIPNQPEFSHSFASFVRATWDGPVPTAPCLEVHTISWMPKNLHIRALALLPECGQNLDLHPTLQHALAQGERISLWGPFQITCDLYHRAVSQVRLLGSGKVAYKANDIAYQTDCVSNCIHAISGVVDGHRGHIGITAWGETASYFLVDEFLPHIVDPCRTHSWVATALGLGSYPIIYRKPGEHPHSGMIQGVPYRLFGGERNLHADISIPIVAASPLQ